MSHKHLIEYLTVGTIMANARIVHVHTIGFFMKVQVQKLYLMIVQIPYGYFSHYSKRQ